MKVESLVIAHQHVAVNLYLGLVHTARHVPGVGLARNLFLNHEIFFFFHFEIVILLEVGRVNYRWVDDWDEVVTR
jgi:hypothetical protein